MSCDDVGHRGSVAERVKMAKEAGLRLERKVHSIYDLAAAQQAGNGCDAGVDHRNSDTVTRVTVLPKVRGTGDLLRDGVHGRNVVLGVVVTVVPVVVAAVAPVVVIVAVTVTQQLNGRVGGDGPDRGSLLEVPDLVTGEVCLGGRDDAEPTDDLSAEITDRLSDVMTGTLEVPDLSLIHISEP